MAVGKNDIPTIVAMIITAIGIVPILPGQVTSATSIIRIVDDPKIRWAAALIEEVVS